MKLVRLLMTFAISLALVAGGLPAERFVPAPIAGGPAGQPTGAVPPADEDVAVASEVCPGCDTDSCPATAAGCTAPCVVAVPAMAILCHGAVLALNAARHRGDTAARNGAGRTPRPDPFPPRA